MKTLVSPSCWFFLSQGPHFQTREAPAMGTPTQGCSGLSGGPSPKPLRAALGCGDTYETPRVPLTEYASHEPLFITQMQSPALTPGLKTSGDDNDKGSMSWSNLKTEVSRGDVNDKQTSERKEGAGGRKGAGDPQRPSETLRDRDTEQPAEPAHLEPRAGADPNCLSAARANVDLLLL